MKAQTLESETFGSGSRNYFIDFSRATNHSDYIKITRSDRQADNTYVKNSVVIFEEDFSFLIESFSMLFTSVIHRKEKNSANAPVANACSAEFRKRGIKSWAPEKRPREKLLEAGAGSVSNVELLALLIGSGTKKETAVDLSARILKSVGGDLDALSRLPLKKLTRFAGIGNAKAVNIMAAMELSRRRNEICFPLKLKAG